MKKWLKNSILSLVLVAFLFSGTMIFSSCGGKTYALGSLNSDYLAVVSGYDNITISTSGEISFNYSYYESQGTPYLQETINSTEQYRYLNSYYNVLFENSMKFIYYALPLCSKASVEVDESVYEELQADLQNLGTALDSVSKRMDYLAEIVKANNGDGTVANCLNRLNSLYSTYDDLFQAIFSLNSTMSNIFYNYALNNGNPDVSAVSYSSFNEAYIQTILSNMTGRINYHISNYSLVFVELNLVGTSVADEITESGISPLTEDFTLYETSVAQIDITIPDDTASKIANYETYRAKFYDLAVEMYNLQLTMSNNYQLYRTASNTIKYNVIKNDSNATGEELMCVYIMDNYASLVEQYHAVLSDAIDIIKA